MNFGLFPIITVSAVLGAWFGVPVVFRWLASRELARRTRARKAIVLTYDDGPSDILTSRLADLLKSRGISATFFVIGRKAVANPDALHRLLEDGHEIGNHSQEHLNAWKTGPLRALRDIRDGAGCLLDLGADHTAFRPPFGKSTLATLLCSLRRGTRLAFWTHDSRDSWNRLPVSHVLEQLGAAGGGVVLMHDFDLPRRGPSPEKHRDYVLLLTESIIDFAEANNFRIIPFRDLFDDQGGSLTKGTI